MIRKLTPLTMYNNDFQKFDRKCTQNWQLGIKRIIANHWRWIVTAGVSRTESKDKREFLKWMKKESREPGNLEY